MPGAPRWFDTRCSAVARSALFASSVYSVKFDSTGPERSDAMLNIFTGVPHEPSNAASATDLIVGCVFVRKRTRDNVGSYTMFHTLGLSPVCFTLSRIANAALGGSDTGFRAS